MKCFHHILLKIHCISKRNKILKLKLKSGLEKKICNPRSPQILPEKLNWASQLALSLKGLLEFEKKINGTTFRHLFLSQKRLFQELTF